MNLSLKSWYKPQNLLSLLLSLGMGSSVLIAMPVFAEDSSLVTITRRGHIRIGVDASIGGAYIFWNPKTQYYDGFEWEIAQEIAAKLKLEARPINVPWSTQLQNLSDRQIDIILSTREKNSLDSGASKGKFAETISYYRTSQRILVRKDTAQISTLRDLIGRRVGVVANSGGAAVIETYNNNRGKAIRLFSSRDIDRMFAQLRDRQLDAMLIDEPVAVWQVRNDPNLAIVGDPLLPINLVAIVNTDDETLKKAVDRVIIQLRQEGKLESILRRWKLWDNNQKFLESTEALPAISFKIIMQFLA